MIIGIDAGALGGNNKNLQAGVYIAAVNLFQQLKKIDRRNEYIFYSFSPIEKVLLKSFPTKSKNIVLPSRGWLYISLPLAFLKRKPDVFLAISQAMPWYHSFKTIGFIHGLDFLTAFHKERNKKMVHNSRYLIQHADRVITTSQFLQKELFKKYKRKNIDVVPLGVSEMFFQKVAAHKEKNPYFLFVGTLKVSKNIPNILKSFALFQKKTKQKYRLLVIGSNFWLDQEIQRTIRTLHLENHIQLIPPINPQQLVRYYRGAVALVSPSLYEGFGLPFTEAMAAGCPIIASTVGAIPEVVGDVGLLADPKDYKTIAKYMMTLATNKKTRATFIKKGYKQAKKYSWEQFARQVLAIIESL